MNWQGEAPLWIERATKDLPESATLAERRAALRTVGWQFHGGTSWGKKVWSKYCRRYLEQHGLEPLPALGSPKCAQHIKLEALDITFPFKTKGAVGHGL